MLTKILGDGYEIRQMTDEAFWPLWDKHSGLFTDNAPIFMWRDHISENEKDHLRTLGKNMGAPVKIRLAVFKDDEFIGWSIGDQHSADVYYMRNSAILPEHRRRGLYTELLNAKLELLKSLGFQKVFSRHSATNNSVIIPKLKAGFIMTSFEMDDMFGVLVHLTYFTNPLRRKMMDYRAGDLNADEEIKKALGLS